MERDSANKGQSGNCDIGHYGQNRTRERSSSPASHRNAAEINQDINKLLETLA